MLTATAAALTATFLLYGAAAPPPVREQQEWVLDTLNLERAWTITKGRGVTVAVIDSGVDPALKELRGRVELAGDMTTADAVPGEPGQHGTAMAALIAGSGEGKGMIGAAPESRILSLPIALEEETGGGLIAPDADQLTSRMSPVARAIRYAADHGAKVVSMSIGTYGTDRSEREAVSYALRRGVVLVAAVGNDGTSAYAKQNRTSYWTFPAGYSGVIGVSAVDRMGRGAPFSSDNLSVTVAAPGMGVPVAKRSGGYTTADGTSPSAALVAGVAALIKSRHPEMRPEIVAQALVASTKGRPLTGYDDKIGFGVVDAAAALAAADRLAGQQRSATVPAGAHFGEGENSPAPSRPGPDPLRMWIFGLGAVLGLAAFGWAVATLSQRR
ncbi:S8 family serine peptidase [Nonomuraea sp. NPDC050328]|uniref:S8 family serine peptidase n=1 Tax=Nonomuraea sp. NPDC050328 TaxID=3364361 RepID=UPI0037996D61